MSQVWEDSGSITLNRPLAKKGEREMEAGRVVELIFKLSDSDDEETLHKPVCEHLEKEHPEEFKFIEGLPDDQNDKIWALIAESIDKAFEIGFDKGFGIGLLKGQQDALAVRK